MAEKEEPIANDDTGKIKVKAKKEKQPSGNETKGNVTKVEAKMKKNAEVIEQSVTKVDLSKPLTPKESDVDGGVVAASTENTDIPQEQDVAVLEEITNEEKVEEVAEAVEVAVARSIQTGNPLPENIEKLVSFMEETGGDITDYVTLNQNYDDLDNHTLLREYYKSTKSHLSEEEVDFVMEDKFAFDEDIDDERDIKRKKLAMKEQVAQAKQHLESVKSKYYEDIKSGSKLTVEQQEAIEFFTKHNEESEQNYELSKKQASIFEDKTNKVFNDKFKGFEYNVGEKKFRFNVKDTSKLKETQGDINNFIRKFLTKDNTIDDAQGYHKGLFTAMNPDQVANHFYEQGKADALRDSIAKSKNVSMDPRQSHQENVNTSGFSARVLNQESDFKFKIKNNKFKN
tara:strand:+ start:2526 stop:3722 length:1197 start_codon:yes stop_codon:yes gene_type:complete